MGDGKPSGIFWGWLTLGWRTPPMIFTFLTHCPLSLVGNCRLTPFNCQPDERSYMNRFDFDRVHRNFFLPLELQIPLNDGFLGFEKMSWLSLKGQLSSMLNSLAVLIKNCQMPNFVKTKCN